MRHEKALADDGDGERNDEHDPRDHCSNPHDRQPASRTAQDAVEIGQPPPEQMYGQRGARVETKRTSRSRGSPGEDEEEPNHRRQDDRGDEHDEENHWEHRLVLRGADFQLFVLRHHFLCLRVALDQQLIGREQRAVGFGPLRSLRTAPRLLDL